MGPGPFNSNLLKGFSYNLSPKRDSSKIPAGCSCRKAYNSGPLVLQKDPLSATFRLPPVFAGQLSKRFFFFYRFESNFGFEGRRMIFTLVPMGEKYLLFLF